MINKSIRKLLFVAALSTLVGPFSMHAITVDTVAVVNAGNPASATGLGAVSYSYQAGKYEVTNSQYAAFLNAVASTDNFGLYNNEMDTTVFGGITRSGSSGGYTYAAKPGFGNKPVTYVSFWDAARFTNWLNNGQGSASTETGSYTLNSVTNPPNAAVSRNSGSTWVLPNADEWYKAAYYDASLLGGFGGYWKHATQSVLLGQNNPFTDPDGANYNDGDYANGGVGGPGATDVGTYANAASYYGTFDQAGNVWEWNEQIALIDHRGRLGGSWFDLEPVLQSSNINLSDSTAEVFNLGFRVVNLAAIPEPSSFGFFVGLISLLLVCTRRSRSQSV